MERGRDGTGREEVESREKRVGKAKRVKGRILQEGKKLPTSATRDNGWLQEGAESRVGGTQKYQWVRVPAALWGTCTYSAAVRVARVAWRQRGPSRAKKKKGATGASRSVLGGWRCDGWSKERARAERKEKVSSQEERELQKDGNGTTHPEEKDKTGGIVGGIGGWWMDGWMDGGMGGGWWMDGWMMEDGMG
ncbi:hypothetical protein NLG97_g9050 [Lecanicillium saksenae]|uniref:Uncharacterized protein n=1 Tax=Lecanicillium saksenae TaxID=468837 RepID=A0ACC1QJK3_9HYPO|nr:hypothetical protein NLG97_g9050 [Lecanicillium saksenae]